MNRLFLLTGAAGFLGGEICRQLISQGNPVRAFVLPNDPAAKYIPKKELGYTCRPFRETIRDEVQWLREGGYLGA